MRIEIPKGLDLCGAINLAKMEAFKRCQYEVEIEFNGIILTIYKDSVNLDISKIYYLECQLRQISKGF